MSGNVSCMSGDVSWMSGDMSWMSTVFQYGDTEGFEFDTSTPDRTADSRGRPAPAPSKRSTSPINDCLH